MKLLPLTAIALLGFSLCSCGLLRNPSQLPSNILRLPGSIIRNTKNLITETSDSNLPAGQQLEKTSAIALKQTEIEE